PALKALGATLTAVSPQVPERLADIKLRHDFDFKVATDRDNALGRRLGILFMADAASQAAARANGSFIGDVTGTGTWELPMPAGGRTGHVRQRIWKAGRRHRVERPGCGETLLGKLGAREALSLMAMVGGEDGKADRVGADQRLVSRRRLAHAEQDPRRLGGKA